MRGRVFARKVDAEDALRLMDVAAGLPRLHDEGEFGIAVGGRAASRIRSRGVRTEHLHQMLRNDDSTLFALPSPDGSGDDIDVRVFRDASQGSTDREANP